MIRVTKSVKIAGLVVLALALLGALWLQSLKVHRLYREVDRPTIERRQLADSRIHSWMTVEEVAHRYRVTVNEVFQALDIQAQSGDEKLPLQKLENKYHKSRDDMRKGLESLQRKAKDQTPRPAS